MKIKYNAPTTLSFSLVAAVFLLLAQLFCHKSPEYGWEGWYGEWFSAPGRGGFHFGSFMDYLRLFTHVLGHADWAHLFGNLSLILVLGPLLEQSYGSLSTLAMIAITALVTGLLNALVFRTGLMGASGIVFMMILLASFTNFGKGEVPLTFILVIILYLGQQVWQAVFDKNNNISEFAHIIGGFCGSLFGFLRPAKR